jgi:hypothetical protein
VLGLVGVMDIDVHLLGQAGIDLTKGPLEDPYGSAVWAVRGAVMAKRW